MIGFRCVPRLRVYSLRCVSIRNPGLDNRRVVSKTRQDKSDEWLRSDHWQGLYEGRIHSSAVIARVDSRLTRIPNRGSSPMPVVWMVHSITDQNLCSSPVIDLGKVRELSSGEIFFMMSDRCRIVNCILITSSIANERVRGFHSYT